MKNVIEINGLRKRFGDVTAVDDVSFTVREGEFFAFLGVNGAGKSTTISMMCGNLKRDGGSIVIDGVNIDKDAAAVKRKLGVVFQNCALDQVLSVSDNLKYRAALYGITGKEFEAKLAELTELFDLAPLLRRAVGKLSGGQRRRVDIARALVHNPKILVLDEPTTGLDPQTRKSVWKVINRLRAERGMTVFLTTHYMEETADADYVVIIDSGKIKAHASPLELKNTYTGDFVTLYNVTKEEADKLGVKYETVAGAYRIEVPSTGKATELIIRYPEIFRDYEITKGKMDDVFLAVTGIKLEGGGN